MSDLIAMSLRSWPRLASQDVRERRSNLVSVTDVEQVGGTRRDGLFGVTWLRQRIRNSREQAG